MLEIKLLARTEKTNEDEIISVLKGKANITYKFYEVALDNETKAFVDTLEEAENMIKELKAQNVILEAKAQGEEKPVVVDHVDILKRLTNLENAVFGKDE